MTEAGLSPSFPISPTSPLRKPSSRRPRAASHIADGHDMAVGAIRAFLRGQTNYDAFPVSFRLIVLDTKLNVRKALQCLLLNGVVSAPMWNSEECKFVGMFTVSDIIHLIQYYYLKAASVDAAAVEVESFRLESIPAIEKSLGVATPPLIQEHPRSTLYAAAQRLIQTHARRVPLLDRDTETGHEVIVSVLTQYRLLKFIAINCSKELAHLSQPLRRLKIGTYVARSPDIPPNTPKTPSSPTEKSTDETNYGSDESQPYYPLATATLNTPVFDVVHMFSKLSISAVPIVDADGVVVNLYETVDIITLVRLGKYNQLSMTISEVLNLRAADFPGVVICTANDSLGTLLELIKKRRVHRLVVVEGEEEERRGGKKGRLLGVITLSDVLKYLVGDSAKAKTSTKDTNLEVPKTVPPTTEQNVAET